MRISEATNPPSSADSQRNFGFLVRDVARLYVAAFERAARELGLTLSQCKVLGHLARNEGISQARLAELSDTDPMTLVRILDRMQQDRWIERRADPSDRRAHRLYLHDPARPVLNRMWKIAEQCRDAALVSLSTTEREQLIDMLERMHATLSTMEPR